MRSVATSISITPRAPTTLFGRGGRTKVFESVSGELEANALLLEAETGFIAVVSIDSLFSSSAFKSQVLGLLSQGVREGLRELIFVASHTHHAPALDPSKPALGRVDEGYFNHAATMVASSIDKAASNLRRTDFLEGRSTCRLNAIRRSPGLRISRVAPYVSWRVNMRPRRTSDELRTLRLLVGQDPAGQPTFVLWNWTCHATAYPASRNEVCADFPGEVRSAVRERLGLPGLPVLFLPGFCGDVRADPSILPLDLRQFLTCPTQRPFAVGTAKVYAGFCEGVSGSALEALGRLESLKEPSLARSARVQVPMTELMSTTSNQAVECVHVDAGSVAFFFASAEVCSPYHSKLANLLPSGTFLSGYADHVSCYLPADKQVGEGGHEVVDFIEPFGLNGRFRQAIESRILQAASSLVAETQRRPHLHQRD